MQMHAGGADAATIRAAIEAKYRASFPTMTPTPPIATDNDRRKAPRTQAPPPSGMKRPRDGASVSEAPEGTGRQHRATSAK
jgi:hypothetical protein